MCEKAYGIGREMIWERSAGHYLKSFQQARLVLQDQPSKPLAVRTLAEQQADLPIWRLDHLERLTDSTGIFQHATYTIPHFAEGYCIDDNARALLLAVLLDELGHEAPIVNHVAITSAAFLQAGFNQERSRFRNFMSFDRRWLEEVGSEDCQGRSVWAMGACVGRSRRPDLPAWAASFFEVALLPILEMSSPRAWAFGLLGDLDYLRRFSGDRVCGHARDVLTALLVGLHERTATPDWPWFEEILSYDNARLCHALIASGRDGRDPKALEIGLRSLSWLVGVQRAPQGHFRAIGCHGFYRKGGEPARFDQQPVEANATVSACLEAYRATQDPRWLDEARSSFEWFSRPQRSRPGTLRPGHGRLLRRSASRPRQPQPGSGIHPGVSPLARRDEPAGNLPGGIPPGTVGFKEFNE